MISSAGLAAPLTITGVSEPIEANIRLHLDISDAPCETPTWQLESWWENAEEQAKTALQAFGYFSPEVDLRPVARDQACWHASMQVQPGKPTTITAVDLQLGDAQTPSRWPSALRDAIQAIHDLKGQTLVSSAYESRKSQLIFTAAAEGFLDATLKHSQITVTPAQARAHIAMQFDPGERYVIGDIVVAQTGEQMAPEFLQSLVQQHRSRPATSAVLRDIRQSLRTTRYFDGVQARYLSDERSQGNVGVKLDLAVSGDLHYAVGVGFSSDTGARVRWDLDRFRLNSEGDQFFLQTVLAQDDRQITATLKRPDHDRPATHWTSLEAGLREERNSAVRYDSAQLAVSQHFADPEGWQRNRFLEALIERDQDASADVTRKMLTLGSQWERSSRNAAIFATQGYRLSATARLGLETLASDTDLLSISGQAQSIFSFDTDSRWLLSLNAGALHAGSFAALPQSLRFYAGGENSVRGYDFREIDARESIADNPGGRYLIRGSVEYERRFSSRYSWAVFSDAGDAFLDDADLKTSAGVGFRWYSPIGPVRIDVAKPLQDGLSPRLHLSFGAVF